MNPSRHRLARLALVLGTTAFLPSCQLIQSYTQKTPEQKLVDALQAAWATPGNPFLEGVVGSDTIATVTSAGTRSWDVTIPDPNALGGSEKWTLDITRAQILPVRAGDAYAKWLGTRARELGLRTFLPLEVTTLLSSGRVLAVGDVEARFGKTGRVGRSTVDRVAYLEPGSTKDEQAHWVLQPNDRPPIMLRDALHKVYDDMIANDDRVLTCLGVADRSAAPHPLQRKCIAKALEHRFGDGA
jgi:hypothetical protein